MKFFTTLNSKNIIVTLRIVKVEKNEMLTSLLMIKFHDVALPTWFFFFLTDLIEFEEGEASCF